jgi:AbiV family abortive infection protein
MPEQLTKYKFKRIATESLKNGIRLHFDSILLFNNKSYPTSLQIAIIAIEEIAKAKWVEHYYYSSITNDGFPEKDFEQKWLKLLYFHPKKQYAFLARELFEYSPKFEPH